MKRKFNNFEKLKKNKVENDNIDFNDIYNAYLDIYKYAYIFEHIKKYNIELTPFEYLFLEQCSISKKLIEMSKNNENI